MANEILAQISLTCTKNGVTLDQSLSLTKDMAGDEMTQNVQIIGTSAEAIALGDVSTIGYILFKNLDATNYVDLSMVSDGSVPFSKLLAGDFAMIKAASATIYAKANTAAIKLLVFAIEL